MIPDKLNTIAREPLHWQDERADLRRQLAKAKSANHGYRTLLRKAQDRVLAAEEKLSTVRAEVLEEAAKVCDRIKDEKNEFGLRTKNHYGPTIATGAMLGAEAIRALAKQEGDTDAVQGHP